MIKPRNIKIILWIVVILLAISISVSFDEIKDTFSWKDIYSAISDILVLLVLYSYGYEKHLFSPTILALIGVNYIIDSVIGLYLNITENIFTHTELATFIGTYVICVPLICIFIKKYCDYLKNQTKTEC
ncbi:hypothetical protein [Celerinatantimonas yamalensis]|uniref:Uncharacterized protein n=1 Tax=Celerinatantimonas yamalensis TaxID=559956 RepID=A0ABW9G5L6_9GAMM